MDPRTAFEILVAGAVIGLGVLAWVFIPVFQGSFAAQRDLGSHRLEIGAWLSIIVLNALISLPLAPFIHVENGLTTVTFIVAALSTDIPMLLIVYVRLVLPGAATWQDLGLKPLPWDYVLRIGLAAGLVGLVAIEIVGNLLSLVGIKANQIEQFQFAFTEGPLALAALIIAAGLVAPFVEELFFRGFLFGIYRRRQPTWLAYLVSSLLFTLLHLEPTRMDLSQMAALSAGIFLLAVLLAWVYDHTGSLFPGMLAHSVNNVTAVIVSYYSFGIR